MTTRRQNACVIAAGAAALAAVAALGLTTPDPVASPVELAEVCRAFAADPAGADAAYRGRWLSFEAVPWRAAARPGGGVAALVAAPDGLPAVGCNTDRPVEAGRRYAVRGLCRGLRGGVVVLDHCRLTP